MSPMVFEAFSKILSARMRSGSGLSVLEVGAGSVPLLSAPALDGYRKVALNLRFDKISDALRETEMVVGNCNSLQFEDESFDCVLSCSMLEHDKYFWRSCAEIRRVLKPGGYFVAGVPIYMTLPIDKLHTTLTYARHGMAYNADFYRFSEQAVREVFFEEYAEVTDEVIVRRFPNPYLVAAARK